MYNGKKLDDITKFKRDELKKGYMENRLESKGHKRRKSVKPLFSYAKCNQMTVREMEKMYIV